MSDDNVIPFKGDKSDEPRWYTAHILWGDLQADPRLGASESPFVETEVIAGKTLVKGSKLRPVDGLWPVERVSVPELAMIFWEKLHPDRHPQSATMTERHSYILAMEAVLEALVRENNVSLYP